VVIAGARDSARMVAALRSLGCAAPILCGPSAGRRAFLEEAGPAAEGILFPWLLEGSGGDVRDYAAAHAYDATRLAVAAIRRAGLNRARIRDAVAELSGFEGASGRISWDNLGQNTRAVRLGTIQGGRAVPASRQLSFGAIPRAFILGRAT
jgi:ABC-type branched-subunit amino acid transport system substrate-binding protein